MTAVEAVLFDLDDTICVYERTADEVLSVAFDAVGVEPFFTGEEYVARFDEFLDAGETIEPIRRACFEAFAEEAGRDPSVGRAVAEAYTAERDQTAVEFCPGAKRALDAMADRYPLAMVTNGDPDLQRPKLRSLGIEGLFDAVVYAGVDTPYKPDPEPFHLALESLAVSPERAVHVGNSLGSDVAGAHAAGVRSVWLRRDGIEPDPEPHHSVDSMHEVADEPWRAAGAD